MMGNLQLPDRKRLDVADEYCWAISSAVAPASNAATMVSSMTRVPRDSNDPVGDRHAKRLREESRR
jgi:hypothetical protein